MSNDHTARIAALQQHAPDSLAITDTLSAAVQKLMLPLFVQLLECEPHCRDGKNLEALNKMRGTACQLYALVITLEQHQPNDHTSKFRKRLGKLVRRLDGVRELDRMSQALVVYGESVNHRMAIAGIVAQLNAQRILALDRLNRYLNSRKYEKFLVKMESDLMVPPSAETPEWVETPADHPKEVRHLFPVIAYNELAAVRACESHLEDTEHPPLTLYDTLNQRVQDFQLIVKSFEPVLGRSITGYNDALIALNHKTAQIAHLNDALARLIRLPRTSLDPSQVAALKRYRRYLRDEREKHHHAFADDWHAFNQRQTQEKLATALLVLR